jgi:hypothetical protein
VGCGAIPSAVLTDKGKQQQQKQKTTKTQTTNKTKKPPATKE